MAIMCQELPSLNTGRPNSEGRLEGYTQVTNSTFKGLINGSVAGGACSYIANLENGECADPESRVKNARCSIELGACLFNQLLTKCDGDEACAYNIYNTGSPYKQANGLSDFLQGYQNLVKGQICAKSTYNKPVWDSIYYTVARLTGGRFNTDSAQIVQVSKRNLKTSVEDKAYMKDPDLNKTTIFDRLQNMLSSSGGKQTQEGDPGDVISGGSLLNNSSPNNYDNNTPSDDTQISSLALDPEKGAMYCMPKEMTQNEEFLLAYLCPGGTEFEKVLNFTATDSYGVVKLRAGESKKYSVVCKKPDNSLVTASCSVNVR